MAARPPAVPRPPPEPRGPPLPTPPLGRRTPPRWAPDSDTYETARTIEVVVDLAGMDEDDFEVHLFEDALLVEGHRRLPAPHEEAVYHAAAIRQGPFRVEIPLPAPVDSERVEAR